MQAGVILYPRLHPLSAFAPDVTVRALPEGIQHVLSPSRNIRNPRNLNFFYFPTVQQDHALSLLIAPFRQLLAAEQHVFIYYDCRDPLLLMNCFCQLMHLLYWFIIPKSGACDCLFCILCKNKSRASIGMLWANRLILLFYIWNIYHNLFYFTFQYLTQKINGMS